MKERLFFERYLCTNVTGKQHICFQFRTEELTKELEMFRQDHKKSSLGLCELHVADNYDDSRVWTKIIVLVTVWELYRIFLVMFMVPKSTHTGTQVQLPPLRSEMCLVTSHLWISKTATVNTCQKIENLRSWVRRELWCSPGRNQSQAFRHSKWRGKRWTSEHSHLIP